MTESNITTGSENDNFGYPRSLVIASTDPHVLIENKEAGRSLVWRRPDMGQTFARCVNELFAQDVNRMNALNCLPLHINVRPDGKILARPAQEWNFAWRRGALGIREELFDLPTLLPGASGAPLVTDIETRIHETALSFFGPAQNFVMLIWTQTQRRFGLFHMDNEPVIGLCYSQYGTEFGPDDWFYPTGYTGDRKYRHQDADVLDKLHTLKPGDVSNIIHPHRTHGTQPHGQPRLWVGIYRPS